MSGVGTDTPLMQQYREIKARHPDALLLFRMGDFFEMFYDDAKLASRVLGLTLTSRNNGGAAEVPLAGVPVKAVQGYVRQLVAQGHRVAICEQLEDPKLAKGVVKRGVVETITPGAAFADDLLDGARNTWCVAVHSVGDAVGLAAADLSTGEVRLLTTTVAHADATLARLAPRELVVARDAVWPAERDDGIVRTVRDAWEFDPAMAREDLTRQYGVASLDGFGIEVQDTPAIAAAGALLRYLRALQPGGLPHLARPTVERDGAAMALDEMTRRNLELVDSLRGGTSGTVLEVFDRAVTPMGQRRLRQWLLSPLLDRGAIEQRHAAVAALLDDALACDALRRALDGVRDLERLAAKAAAGRATPRDLRALGDSLLALPDVRAALDRLPAAGALADVRAGWDEAAPLATRITTALVERPTLVIGDGGETIAPGFDAEVDELRALALGGKEAIAAVEARERTRSGISSLKVGYNKVFGYYLEITNTHRDRIPADYIRKQTLTGAERYVTPELKEFEEKILHATERLQARERQLFDEVRREAGAEVARLQSIATRLATLDVLGAFAETAAREGYARPTMHEGFELEITAGRHPVVERMMPREQFIPNDVRLSAEQRVIILTGPNMAGKSTILRMIGLVQLLAQCGSFVPASAARLPLCDRVFTRVGASDNLARGQSTFMVEMAETSAILHGATARSLVLLDEIGRGTSTYDGVAIAWAVTEHVHDVLGAKTVFATHYHELTQLADELAGVKNFTVSVREVGDQVLFLHRLQPGPADRSYGVEVGRLAGLPPVVIARAREVLRLLEGDQLAASLASGRPQSRRGAPVDTDQLGLFAAPVEHPVVARLKAVDVNGVTPLQALAMLDELARVARS
ncbi:MAG: DNA mismatch repair protein MutS [Gemmatimonadaceae bacterium]|nr:DNA mismatch repair protein MutS [Gemmatimonadaceae bacterium]